MKDTDDELLGFTAFAKRINKSAPYIYKLKNPGKLDPAIEGKKIYFKKACKILKIDPNNIPKETIKQAEQKKYQALKSKPKKKNSAKKSKEVTVTFNNSDDKSKLNEIKDKANYGENLLDQIKNIINSKDDDNTYLKLDSLETKTKILKNFYAAEKEKLAFEKELGNLFDKESIERILSFAVNSIRNSLLNLANNYAVNLEGLSKAEIKEYVEEDINKLLEVLQETGKEIK